MRLVIAAVTPRRKRLKSAAAQSLVDEYVARIAHYTPADLLLFESEAPLLSYCARGAGRTPAALTLLDSRGALLTSEEFAEQFSKLRESGASSLVWAIGPASGWSAGAQSRADARVSLGRMTLPHELALVVLAEQLYRAQTILAGHPYHSGH
jgi:23S rRNA (pseudouridine1915-N3)-methyltransferase